MSIPKVIFDKYYHYEELKDTLYALAEAAPDLCKLKVIGQSWQKRDIIALEITDYNTGIPEEKTGYYTDACTHAEEFCGTNVMLYLAWYLLENFDKKAEVRKLLEDTIIYIIPRLNPDGVEMALQTYPWVGNGRYLPGEIQPDEGLYVADINGDGVIAQMRVEDPAGEWKVSDKDPRLMVVRDPYETGGKYYRLYPEGYIRGEVIGFPIPKPRDGNLNRNYAGKWTPEGMQYGARELPLSDPEVRAVSEYILARPNIGGVMAAHTNAGYILRPFSDKGDEYFKGRDLDIYESLGAIGTEVLGYKVISTFNGFTTDKSRIRGGTIKDWTYDYMGMPCIITEFWNIYDAANVTRPARYQLGGNGEATDLAILKWADEKLDGKAYFDWEEVDHPQLGKVEVGGWNRIFVYRNPPTCMLEDMARRGALYVMRLAQTLPKLTIRKAEMTRIAEGLYKITAVVRNAGYLPTYLTSQAIAVNQAPPVKVQLTGNCDFTVECCTHPLDIGHLEGRFGRTEEWSPWIHQWKATERKAEWVIRTDCKEPEITITVSNPRSGVARQTVK